MIVKKEKAPLYGKYFLVAEAPETDGTPKRRVKVIDVKPANLNDRRRIDFTQDASNEETPLDNDLQTNDTVADNEDNMPLVDDTDAVDFTAIGDDEETNTAEPENINTDDTQEQDVLPQEETEPNPDEAETTVDDATGDEPVIIDDQNADFTDGAGEEDAGEIAPDTTTDENNVDAPDTGDDTDFTADTTGDETGTDDNADADTMATDDTNNQNGASVDYDSTRKYLLFKEFMKLSNSVEGYIDKLENTITSNPQLNQIYKTSTEKLRDIRELIVDYMVMRFSISSYVQSLIFFNSQVAAIELIFSIITKAQAELKKNT